MLAHQRARHVGAVSEVQRHACSRSPCVQRALSIHHIIAYNRHVVTAFAQQDLEHHVGGVQKTKLGRAEVELPHARETLAHHGDDGRPLGRKALPPIAQSPRVVQPPDAISWGERISKARRCTSTTLRSISLT